MLKDIVSGAGGPSYNKAVERLKVYVHVPVPKHLILEAAAARKVCVQGKKGGVFLGGVGEIGPGRCGFFIFGHFPAGGTVVFPGCARHSHLELYVGPVHIGLGKVRIQFYGLVVVCKGVVPALHFKEIAGPVEVCEDIAGVYGYNPVHI